MTAGPHWAERAKRSAAPEADDTARKSGLSPLFASSYLKNTSRHRSQRSSTREVETDRRCLIAAWGKTATWGYIFSGH